MKSHNQNYNNLHEPSKFDNFDYEEEDDDDGVFDNICEDGDDECETFVLIVLGIIIVIGGIVYLILLCISHCCGRHRSSSIDFSSNTATSPLYPTD